MKVKEKSFQRSEFKFKEKWRGKRSSIILFVNKIDVIIFTFFYFIHVSKKLKIIASI